MNLMASKEAYDLRMKICAECEHFIKPIKVCGVCGCAMLVKARLSMTKCPRNKWMRDDGKDKNTNSEG